MSVYDRILERHWPGPVKEASDFSPTASEATNTALAVSHAAGPESKGMAHAVKAKEASDSGNKPAAAFHHVNAAIAHNDAGHGAATTAHLNAAKSNLAECMGQ